MIRVIRFISVTLLFSASAPFFTFGATDSFTVQTIVGNDFAAPTVPGNFTVQAIASNQIDLDWDASSDNVAVSGYQVFRDMIQIATTSLTSYSDTGLASSTLFSYYITAFDSSLNFSASTSVVSTSTLAVVPPILVDADEDNTGRYFRDIDLSNISYNAGRHHIDISYTTVAYVRSVIRWGRTSDFESGFISTDAYSKSHTTRIDDLTPGTVYEIEIVLTDRSGRNTERQTFTVKTEEAPDETAPPNVSTFAADISGDQVLLTWKNPEVSDFSYVRVLSSDLFYPTHQADGWLIYEGSSESVVDDRTLAINSGRYYTVFTYDENGNFSSGAVTYAARASDGEVRYVPVVTVETGESGAMTTDILFSFNDIHFFQNDSKVNVRDGRVVLDGEADTILSIPYHMLPEHLKTIVVHLADPEDKNHSFSFLLRINSDKTAYEARFAPLYTEAIYPTSVDVFNYKTNQLFVTDGEIETKFVYKKAPFPTQDSFLSVQNIVKAAGFLCLILLLFFLFFIRRRAEDSAPLA